MTYAKSPFAPAMALAKRLLKIGINPYQSEAERYVVLIGDGSGEILDWGRPIRGTRFFGPNAIRKDRPMVADFAAFSKQVGLYNCVYWGVGLTGAKANPDALDAALKSFNERINIEFSELRKSGRFEMLLLAIHPRYDEATGLFDLHAHFVARVPQEHRDAVKHRLRIKFSKTDFPDDPIRKAAAVATYMLWGIFRNKLMLHWPDNALSAAWRLTQMRFRFVRTGGGFAQWRASNVPVTATTEQVADKERRRRNRNETADTRQQVVKGDRLLSKVLITIRGVRVAALLFEAAQSGVKAKEQPAEKYSSATNIATQELFTTTMSGDQRGLRRLTTQAWDGLRNAIGRATARLSSLTRKIREIGKIIIGRFRC